jgi:hypothetical protein
MEAGKLRQRVPRTRVNGSKLLELRLLQRSLWIRGVLVRAQEGQLEGPIPLRWVEPFRFCARCYRFCHSFRCLWAFRSTTSSKAFEPRDFGEDIKQ